jgi:hypothetical protein
MARLAATGEHKAKAARQMRVTAARLDADHPEMMAGDHLRDAALVLERGSTDGAKRHLDAAMFMLTPQSLIRHGIRDDDGHADAKHLMHTINRHRLHVEDIEDIHARNDRLRTLARARRGEAPTDDDEISEARLVAAANADSLAILLAGPKGYVHGWIKATDAEHLHGMQVTGAVNADDERTVIGIYQHDAGVVVPRHGRAVRVTHVRHVTTEDQVAAQRRQQRKAAGLLGTYRAAYGIAGDWPGVELSARTPFLARTPSPRGRPGGPGLYGVKGMGHTPYMQQVVRALIEERGMPPKKAYGIARAAIRKWAARSRHPEVRAAAGAAEAGEIARQGRARLSHANDWAVADALVELACGTSQVIELFNPYHAPPGTGGGQFTTASGAGQGAGKQQGGRAAKRRQLVRQIASLHRQIAALRAQLPATHRGPSRTGKSRSSAPAKRGAGATSAQQARQGKPQSAKVAARKTASVATIHAKIAALRAELQADIAALRKLT